MEALAESFNASLKRVVLRDKKVFDDPMTCRQDVFRWCMRYNTRRRHSWCNLIAPDVSTFSEVGPARRFLRSMTSIILL
ncbi:transposase [Corynebacterium macginleyi]|nr:transposase [Corynebacterium macginleyi]MBK4162078.1 transposase [Corynebacterium macginleyi]MBK4174313.1 transposase [Corynebacterium macginleyi]MBK4183054.1 transposase [Corynebacterium macginleyi]